MGTTAVDASAIDTADTYGWDTVFAVHMGDVNAAIVAAGSSPAAFAVNDKLDGYALTGRFADWQLAPGGSGDLVRLAIPFRDAVLTGPGGPAPAVSGTAVVELRLDFLHQAGPQPAGAGLTLELRVSATAAGTPHVANINRIDYDGTPPDFMGNAALSLLLGLWLNANLGDFDHVFATVDLNRSAAQGAFQWLQPTDVAYAYSDLGDAEGALAVLCMTEGRPSSGLVQQVSPVVLPAGRRAAFLVSRQRLLSKLMLPAMPQLFQGSPASSYALSASGASIVNANGAIGFQVQHKHKTYKAQVLELSLAVVGEELQFAVTTRIDVSPGIHAFCRSQNFMGVRLVDTAGGGQTLSFYDARTVAPQNWTTKDPGFDIAEDVLGAIVAVAALVAMVATDGAAIGVVAMVVGALAGAAGGAILLSTSVIEQVKQGAAPEISALLLDCTAPIRWTGGDVLRLQSAALNDALQLTGTLCPARAAAPPSTA
jgi:hypothetical protein